jgi:hypothetical protein
MNVTIDNWPTLWNIGLPVLWLIALLGLAFAIFGIKTRSPFFFIATLLCMLTLLFSTDLANYTWVQMAVGMVGVWAILAMIKTIMTRGGEG